MNLLRTLFNGTERASTRRTLSTWKDHQTCLGKCENAKTQSFLGHSVDNELGLRTSCQARSLNTAKMIHDKFIVKKRKHTNTTETVNTARLHDQWNGRLSTCLLKASLAHEKSAARWKNTKNIHLTSIFNISDQGPKKFPKWVLGISKWAFSGQAEGQEMPKNKYWELQIQHFWAGPRKCQIWASGSAWETSKWILEASKWVLPNHVGLDKAREMATNGFRCYKIKFFGPCMAREMPKISFGCRFWRASNPKRRKSRHGTVPPRLQKYAKKYGFCDIFKRTEKSTMHVG